MAMSLGRIYSHCPRAQHVCLTSHRRKTDSFFGPRQPSFCEFRMLFNIYKCIVATMGVFLQLGLVFGFTCMTCPIPDLGLGVPSLGPWILRSRSRDWIYQRPWIVAYWLGYLRSICVGELQRGPWFVKCLKGTISILWHNFDISILTPGPIQHRRLSKSTSLYEIPNTRSCSFQHIHDQHHFEIH